MVVQEEEVDSDWRGKLREEFELANFMAQQTEMGMEEMFQRLLKETRQMEEPR